jgi:hypothetical protein
MFRRTPYIAADVLLPTDGCNSATSHLRMTHLRGKFAHILDFSLRHHLRYTPPRSRHVFLLIFGCSPAAHSTLAPRVRPSALFPSRAPTSPPEVTPRRLCIAYFFATPRERLGRRI